MSESYTDASTFQNHAVTRSSCLSVSLLLLANNFNWWSDKATQIARVLSAMEFLSVQLECWYQWYDVVSGLRYSVRLPSVYQNLLTLTIHGMGKCCVRWCPVKWKICTGACGMSAKHRVKLPTFQSNFWSIFQPVSICYPHTFWRLLLVFSRNCEGERGGYEIYFTLETTLCNSRKGGGFLVLLAVIASQAVGTDSLLLDFKALWSSLCYSAGMYC